MFSGPSKYCIINVLLYVINLFTVESQKIRKIVIRKFRIFSSGLKFKEKLLKFFLVYS